MLTLWAGIQPMYIELERGLMRRFWYVITLWDPNLTRQIRRARRHAWGVRPQIPDAPAVYVQKVNQIREVEFRESVFRALDDFDLMPYEDELFEYFALGYALATMHFDDVVKVDVSDELIALWREQMKWRDYVRFGVDILLVLKLLQWKKRLSQRELVVQCARLGLSAQQTFECITKLIRMGEVKVVKGEYEIKEGRDSTRLLD